MAARSASKTKHAATPAGVEPQPPKPRSRARAAAARKAGAPSETETQGLGSVVEALREVTLRLGAHCDALSRSLGEIPRADDFQPLADHLYEFARTAPRIVERVEELPKAAAPLVESVASLGELTDTLGAFQQSLQESLFLLPRASDYEPLAEPLREFARVSPALVEALSQLARLAGPLSESIDALKQTAERIEASGRHLAVAADQASRLVPESRPDLPPAIHPTEGSLRHAAGEIEAARSAILKALESLPRAADYAPLASQLRELATVSPSLMSWLQELPTVTVPLGQSVESLWQAAIRLKAAGEALATSGGKAADDAPAAQAVEALGRLAALRERLAESPSEDESLRAALRKIGRESARLRRLA